MKNPIYIKILFIMATYLSSCGTDEGKKEAQLDNQAPENVETENESSKEYHKPVSIAVASFSMLKDCEDSLKDQLAYVKDEDQFYVCDGKWTKIDIKGKDGANGKDGITTTKEIESSNRLNEWIDPITGLEWFLGGVGTHAQAQSSCTGDYRTPSVAESLAAIQHGIRNVATDIGATLNFWTNETSTGFVLYATVLSGNANTVAVASNTSGVSIFCVKN